MGRYSVSFAYYLGWEHRFYCSTMEKMQQEYESFMHTGQVATTQVLESNATQVHISAPASHESCFRILNAQ